MFSLCWAYYQLCDVWRILLDISSVHWEILNKVKIIVFFEKTYSRLRLVDSCLFVFSSCLVLLIVKMTVLYFLREQDIICILFDMDKSVLKQFILLKSGLCYYLSQSYYNQRSTIFNIQCPCGSLVGVIFQKSRRMMAY